MRPPADGRPQVCQPLLIVDLLIVHKRSVCISCCSRGKILITRISILGLSKFLRESSFKCEVQVCPHILSIINRNQRDI
jgi:hypothetical protein